MRHIIDFNNRASNRYTPISTGLELFESTNVSVSSSDNLFIDKIVISATGSSYSTTDSVVLTMITGSLITSASAFIDIEDGKLVSVRLTNGGKFSLNTKVSGSILTTGGSGGQIYVSLSKTKQVNSFLSKSAIYDAFEAAKQKVRLLLYTKKGEIARMPELGTRMYEQLLNFDQVQSLDEFVENVRVTLATDIEEQIPEIEIVSALVNMDETDLNKNKIGISLTLRHKLERKIGKIDLSLNDSTMKILKEHFTNDNQEIRPVRYFV